ncbi:S1 family peptidase [Paraconexibacter algicola]|uniref:Peptidase S1 domain-containing protein n=1 Tax=Paraconexibacter algicola TaxID=2133960 RepID=A0A2T4UMG3_9ACTN|nr:serine protease [Paraconexibacter algicola]PTL60422.1 hypothetical protein C7Y72_12610 [Paraconexibacter algicola]
MPARMPARPSARRALLAAAPVVLGLLLPAAASAAATPRVVNGSPAAVDQAPWTVALVQRGVPATRGQFCGGTLIGPATVVTAAHCVAGEVPRAIEVLAGRRFLSGSGGRRVAASRIALAPGWTPRRESPDIAVLTLAEPVEGVPLATLPEVDDAAATRPGRRLQVSGWGMRSNRTGSTADALQAAEVTARSDRACLRAYLFLFSPREMVCANDVRSARDACRGDSGGPLVGDPAGTATLVGVVSFGGERCADPDAPGVYAEVAPLVPWILTQAALPAGSTDDGATATGTPVARIERITCRRLCRVEAAVRGRRPSTVVLRIVRSGGAGRRAVDRTVRMARTSVGRYRAQVDLPLGSVRLSVSPRSSSGRPTGRADVVRIRVV